MIFRNVVSLVSAYLNSNIFRLPRLTNDTDMSVPSGAGTISDPWVYNSLNTADSSIAIGTHDLGTGTYYVVDVQVDTSSETTDVGSITFEHPTPLTPIIVGGNPGTSSLTGYLVTGVEITTKYVKDEANSVGSDNATFTLGACPVPEGNLIIDEVNTTPYWVINNTLEDTAINWGIISNPVQVETFANLPNTDQNLYLIAQTSGTCFWDITVDSDPNDLGYLYLNGTPDSNLNGVGGASQNRTGSFAVAQNDVIRIRYLKDGILNSNNDTLTVNSLYIIDSNTIFLLGTESGIQDESLYSVSMTQNGGAAQSSGWSQFGTYSAEFNLDNGSDDYYDLGSPATCGMDFGTEDFTIEGFAKSTINSSVFYHSIIGNYNGSDPGSWSIFLMNNTLNRVRFTVNGTTSTAATSDLNNDAFHFAVCREGNTTRIYVNGILEASSTQFSNTSIGGTGNVRLGGNQAGGNDAWRGYIDELRVTKGIALYSGPTITVPTAPYPRP